jgi:hypothetical protein
MSSVQNVTEAELKRTFGIGPDNAGSTCSECAVDPLYKMRRRAQPTH